LIIEQEKAVPVPFEDIAVIVLNNREITLTHPVLSACAEYGIGLFSTGDNHQPNGVFLPFLAHNRATRMMRLQMGIDKPQTKRTWAVIIKAKINNQAICLEMVGRGDVKRLQSYANRVRSGDTENMEAQAASYYFPQLYGKGFNRAQNAWVNAALDYGYAVLRGTIARGLVAHGFLPNIGLFHRSEQNAFNLADDLIEPYRPLVDLYVAQNFNPNAPADALLRPMDKVNLVGLLNVDVQMPRGTTSVLSAIEQSVEALARMYEGASESVLELPTLIGLQKHIFEM
jgi:CRISPR-associated protein Cas1